MIRFDHVSKKFVGRSSALTDISVEITDGEFIFLIGSSGAGKTTLLRLLLRDILPSSGTISIDNVNIASIPKSKVYMLRRNIGMVFQDFKLLSDRTVYENVAMGLEILEKRQKDIQKRVNEVLDIVGISEKRFAFPRELSAGELQRVSIARAIVGGPKILLADEPTGNLDPQTAWDILNILQEVHKVGTTIIMATHNATIVDDMKKRTITMEKGMITSDEARGGYKIHPKAPSKKHHGNL